jgi:hypothetical protein
MLESRGFLQILWVVHLWQRVDAVIPTTNGQISDENKKINAIK